jgi:hypothetical protein
MARRLADEGRLRHQVRYDAATAASDSTIAAPHCTTPHPSALHSHVLQRCTCARTALAPHLHRVRPRQTCAGIGSLADGRS